MKKVLIGCVAVFVIIEILDFIIHGIILADAYLVTAAVWRPQEVMMQKMWIFYVTNFVVSFFVSLIFSKGYEGKGIMEGVRFGFYIGMILSMGMAWGMYVMVSVPWQLAIQWFIYALIEYILAGIALSLVFGKKATA
jgi:hypothetical protein